MTTTSGKPRLGKISGYMGLRIVGSQFYGDETDNTIKLAHFSVKEFLTAKNTGSSSPWWQLSEMEGHQSIAARAIEYLLEKTELLSEECARTLPLFNYAAKHWHEHFLKLGDLTTEPTNINKKFFCLFENCKVYTNWSILGLVAVVHQLLLSEHEPLVGSKGSLYRSAVQASASKGHLAVLIRLLKEIEISEEIAVDVLRLLT
ncbi:uncharacterized protein KD926_011367 [Aspergillus affinis]|uniref:uncharacterized protein n=1 Tax=Aspergillus affinis TaxID=1070780 RepID=UPI0022FEEBF7|nr:uncharacterized protein KD926_011367 [Aspergillus affinis]KAI9038029.1 hypothetical protein KD926_011367 [Aspergillus affinis]